MDAVLAFIRNFQNEGTIKTFTEGCCYWFAKVLADRFGADARVWYNPVENHFATAIGGALYDITGRIGLTADWVSWDEYRAYESLDAWRVERYCIMKLGDDE